MNIKQYLFRTNALLQVRETKEIENGADICVCV